MSQINFKYSFSYTEKIVLHFQSNYLIMIKSTPKQISIQLNLWWCYNYKTFLSLLHQIQHFTTFAKIVVVKASDPYSNLEDGGSAPKSCLPTTILKKKRRRRRLRRRQQRRVLLSTVRNEPAGKSTGGRFQPQSSSVQIRFVRFYLSNGLGTVFCGYWIDEPIRGNVMDSVSFL